MLKYDPDIQDLLARCCLDTKAAALELFPDIFYAPFSTLHDQIFNLLDSGERYIAIAAPRGLGKTSIARTVAAREILYRNTNFVLYLSQSATFAEMQTENLKSDLRSSALIKNLFGDIKFSEVTDLDDTFSKLSWVAYGSTLVLPRGAGQQVRGANWRNNRPQLIIIDDLENADELVNAENRKKLKRWFYGDLLRCVNKYDDNYRFIYIDTIKHEDALLVDILNNSRWKSVVLEICGDDLKSKAPNYMSDEEILTEYKAYEEAGELDTFYMELRNIPIASKDATFRREYFQYYDEMEEKLDDNPDIEHVVIVDPAKTVKPHSAESAIVGLAINRVTKRIYVRDVMAAKYHPDLLIDDALAMCLRLKSHVLAIEVTSLHEFITFPVKNAIASKNMQVELVELNARGSKIEKRVPALVPLYRRSQIYHNKPVCMALESQLLSFPKCRRFDIIDALAYIVELLEVGMRYFYTDSDEEPVDEYEPPKDEPGMDDDWQII